MTSHRSFKKAAGLMLAAVLLSRLLGLVREMLIARQFGQSGAVSAYTAAFNLPDLLYFFLSSGALSGAFIPVFTERMQTGRQKEAWQVFSIIACFMGLILTLAVTIAWIYAKPLAALLAVPGFVEGDPKLVELTVFLTRIILPCQLFFFLGGLMMATLESRNKFSARAAGPVIYNLGIIFGAVVLSRWFHIAGLALGTLIGAFVGNIVYTLYCMKKEGFEFHPSLNIRHPGVVRVAKLALPVILGLGLPQIDIIINKWFASFVSSTAPAALNYANRLMQVPLGIFAQAAGTAILPMLAAYAAKNAIDDMRSGISYGLRAIFVENIPATIFIIVMADPLVRTIYMGGEFRPSSVGTTVVPLIWYSVGIFAWAGQLIVARGFFAMQDTITPVLIGTVATVVFIPLNYVLMRAMGTGGIALATSLAVILHFTALTFFLRKRLNGIEGSKILRTTARIVVATAVMGVVCYGVRLGMSGVIGTWQLQDGDIRKPSSFAAKLRRSSTPLDRYLAASLSDDTRTMTAHYEESRRLAGPVRDRLVDELNRAIRDDKLYESERFAQVKLPDEVLKMAAEHPRGIRLTRLNRMLLESAYPDAIVSSEDSDSWLNRLLRGSSKRQRREAVGEDKWQVHREDITDCPLLAAELGNTDNPVSAYLTSRFDDGSKRLIQQYVISKKSSRDLPEALMHDLNITIKTDTIYTPERFEDIRLPAAAAALADGAPRGKSLSRLNRLLLEAAYPETVVKRPADRVESRMGSAATVLVALSAGLLVYFVLLRLMKVDELDYVWSAIRRRLSRRPSGGSRAAQEQTDTAQPLEKPD